MSLTNEDLEKIKAVVDARADLQDARFERRFERIEATMATKDDLKILEERMGKKIDSVKQMLEEDHGALAKDVAEIQALPMIAVELAKATK